MRNFQWILVILMCWFYGLKAQENTISFGSEIQLNDLVSESNTDEIPIQWVNVNTDPETWHKENDLLICSGQPIGVMRSEKQYENFILLVEWRHMEAGGNSGVFVWSDAKPDPESRLPGGVEVQML
ncbi:MAG: DUF1080 domain-containing protein, partial [Pricia sp.]|nr:DUF1080 domain-containing protein [Pricia sp.]